MHKKPFILVLLLLLANNLTLSAQKSYSFLVALPDARIVADKITRGDGDTYGLGDWNVHFSVTLDSNALNIDGQIRFDEKANDFSTLVGSYHHRIIVGELDKCRLCTVALDETEGRANGLNIGARGYRSYLGQGLVRRARIMTDTFGQDVGHVGGIIQFVPVRVLVHCYYADLGSRK